MKALSLYIHIPFCVSKCYYCDFTSFANMNGKIDVYVDCLIKELELYKEEIKDHSIKTIFIGGGTPSSIDGEHIYRILEFIYENFNTRDLIEVTIEVNPGTLDKNKVALYRKAGINRVSMGVQTLKDDLLQSIGRIHTAHDFYRSYEILREGNIHNINVDLIFGLPNQTMEDVLDSLDKVIQLKVNHISYYGLILEEGTVLHQLYEDGKLTLPDEDMEREMYHRATAYLKEKGYHHYEISNYALPGYECKHNLVYWDVKPYLGVGLGSHSNINGKRFWNISNINSYIDRLRREQFPIEDEEQIYQETEIGEFCILGLRKVAGIDKKEFHIRFGMEIEAIYEDVINKHTKDNLIVDKDGYISLTERGLDLSNIVEVDFLR